MPSHRPVPPLFSSTLSPPRWFHPYLTDAALSALPCCFRCCTCGVSTRGTFTSSDEAYSDAVPYPDSSPSCTGETRSRGFLPFLDTAAVPPPSEEKNEGDCQQSSPRSTGAGPAGNTPLLSRSRSYSPPSDASTSLTSPRHGEGIRPCGSRRGKRKVRSGSLPFTPTVFSLSLFYLSRGVSLVPPVLGALATLGLRSTFLTPERFLCTVTIPTSRYTTVVLEEPRQFVVYLRHHLLYQFAFSAHPLCLEDVIPNQY